MKFNKVIFLSIVLIVMFSSVKYAHVSTFELPDVNTETAYQHQEELVGKRQKAKPFIAKTNEARQIASQVVLDIVTESLPKKFKKDASRIATTIVREANKYNLDPLFLMSVIKQESSFRPDAVGSIGEIGLMQIRPTTAEWLNKEFNIVTKVDLKDPVINIKIGAFYFNKLRSKFEQNSRWYITAYNMGATNLKRNIAQNIKPKNYVQHVMRHYVKYLDRLNTAFDVADTNLHISTTDTSLLAFAD